MKKLVNIITEEAKLRGYDVRIRDIAYALMRVKFDDELIAYTVVFGTPEKDSDVTVYDEMESVQYLCRWFEKDLAPKEAEKKAEDIISDIKRKRNVAETSEDGSITFEENRAGIEQQIHEIRELIEQAKDAEPKDLKTLATLQKTEADLRSKLNDKFGASEKGGEQYIIVQPKFNHICEHTRRECWLMTEEWAKEHFHLIKDPKYKENKE